jgi:putative MATE family efflux protein
MPAVFLFIAVAAGLTIAANILVAQYVGARNWDGVKRAVQTSVVLVGGLSLLLTGLGLILVGPLLRAMNTPPDVLPIAVDYMRVFLWTVPPTFGMFLLTSILRGIGDSKSPVYFQAVSVVLNAALDPILMLGWLGAPRLGVNGTAWATLISQAVAVVALIIYVQRRRPLVSPDWRRPRIDRATTWLLVKIGLPAMIQQSVVSIGLLGVTTIVNGFGEDAVAGFGAGGRIDLIAFLPALMTGMAVSTLAGQNIGAGRVERVRDVFRWGLTLSGAVSGLIALGVIGFPRFLLRAFLDDPAAIEIGVAYLRIVGLTYVLYSGLFVSNGIINGSGHTIVTTLISVVALVLVRVPLAWLLCRLLGNVSGVWWATLCSVGCGMTISFLYYFRGGWRKSVLNPVAAEAAPLSP